MAGQCLPFSLLIKNIHSSLPANFLPDRVLLTLQFSEGILQVPVIFAGEKAAIVELIRMLLLLKLTR